MRGTCQTCEHFAALENECREDSPRMAILPGRGGEPGIVGLFPATNKDRWCGKHKPDPNAASHISAPANVFSHVSSNGNA